MKLQKTSNGFTLVEVLVAFAIFASAFISIYRAFGTGLSASHTGTEMAILALEAQSVMAEIGVSIPIKDLETPEQLEFPSHWSVSVENVSEKLGIDRTNMSWNLYEVSLTGRTKNGAEKTFVNRFIAE